MKLNSFLLGGKPLAKNFLILIFSAMILFGNIVSAEEIIETKEEEDIAVYHFPKISPEFYGLLGYRLINVSGSKQAGEYEYLNDYIVAGGEIRLFPFPHRVHIEADMLNKKDYFWDMSYAYKDIAVFRTINRTLFHNLDTIKLIDFNTGTPSPGVSVRDYGEAYGIKTGINNFSLRLKTPDFPAHFYLDTRYVSKDGDMQQRFLGGAGYFNNIERVTEKKEVDWNMKEIILGANSHIGPIEADFSHGEKRFQTDGNGLFAFDYSPAGFPPGATRPAGTFPHSLTPELKSSTNTLKLHTSYTGQLVASATLSKTDKENRDSGAKADCFTGNVEVAYIPYTKLTFVGRYKHKETDFDNPSSLPAGYLGYPSYTTSLTGIRPSVSSMTDTISGIARYTPLRGIYLNAEYTYEVTDREDADLWELPDQTIRRNLTLSANVRPLNKLTLKLKYAHQDFSSPAYNIQPDKSDHGSISISWIPVTWANTMLSYSLTKEKRDDVHYVGTDSDPATPEAENRRTRRDRFLGSVTFVLPENITLTTSYAYFHSKIEQDLIYNSDIAPYSDQLDKDVPYKDTAHSYAVNINYMPQKNLDINAEVSQTKGKGNFYPGIPAALQPVSIASFSELKIRETSYTIGTKYRLKGDWDLGLKYRYNSFRDVIDNLHDYTENGIVRVAFVTVSKKW